MRYQQIGDEMAFIFDDPRILGFWQSPDINGHPDNPMWMVHEYRRDGTVAISTVWVEEGQVQSSADDTLDFAFHAGRLSLGRRDAPGTLRTDDQHWWDQPIRLADGEFRYDDSAGGEISWKKIASVEAIDRDRR